MRTARLFDGMRIPVIGQGTWGFGRGPRAEEVRSLRLGLDLGLRVIDTAEIYAGGLAERIVGEAVAGRRDDAFIVTKVWPRITDAAGVRRAVEGSLARLGVDCVDAVLIHWPSRGIAPSEWIEAFVRLREAGLLRYFGVSNYSEHWLRDALVHLPPGEHLAFNQLPYSPGDRRIELATRDVCRSQALVTMAYSPFGHRGPATLQAYARIDDMARARGASPAQLVLNWLTRGGDVVAIPKASRPEHVRDNARALEWQLTEDEQEQLDRALLPARRPYHPGLPPYPSLFRLAYRFETRRQAR